MNLITDFDPILLQALRRELVAKKTEHQAKCCEILLFPNGCEDITIGGDTYIFGHNDIAFFKPGISVNLHTEAECYFISFALRDKYRIPAPTSYVSSHMHYPDAYSIFRDIQPRISSEKSEAVASMIRELCSVFYLETERYQLHQKTLLYRMLDELMVVSSYRKTNTEPMEKILAHIRDYYTEDIQVSDLITMSGTSKRIFHKTFLACTGMTPNQYIRKLRIEQSKQYLILYPDRPVSQIGGECGYYDASYFSKVFRAYTGYTPTDYRELNTDGFSAALYR